MMVLKRAPLFVLYIAPLLIFAISIVVIKGILTPLSDTLAMAVTYDMTLLAPLVFLVLIWNRKITKLAAVPVFVVGIILASVLIPASQQTHINYIKTFLLPIVELSVLGLLIYKVVQIRRRYKAQDGLSDKADFYDRLRVAAIEFTGIKRVGLLLATEVSMIYYGVLKWRKKALMSNQFTHHKGSGAQLVYGVLLSLATLELTLGHYFLNRWNPTVATILLIIAIYGFVQIFAHVKALGLRPSYIDGDQVVLRAGLFGAMTFAINDIAQIEQTAIDKTSETIKIRKFGTLGELESHNVVIHFKATQEVEIAYGFVKPVDVLMLYVDQKEQFLALVDPETSINSEKD